MFTSRQMARPIPEVKAHYTKSIKPFGVDSLNAYNVISFQIQKALGYLMKNYSRWSQFQAYFHC